MTIKKFSKAVIRTSVAPYELINDIFSSKNNDWVHQLLADPYFNTALKIASPELLRESKKVLKESQDEKEIKKIRQSLLKYVSRMSSRCTPFGLFSGISTLPMVEEYESDDLIVQSQDKHQKSFKLDMNFGVLLTTKLINDSVVKNHTKYYVNTSLYKLGANIRLVTYTIHNKSRSYDLLSVETNEYLDEILQKAKAGVFRNELIAWLVTEDIEQQEATEYIDDLIESQLLISELEPNTIGPEIEHQLMNGLKIIQSRLNTEVEKATVTSYINYIGEVINKLNRLSETKNIGLADYENTLDYIQNNAPIDLDEVDPKFIIQCNLSLNFNENAALSKSREQLVSKAIKIVNHFLTKKDDTSETNLGKFKTAFQQRYEEKFVPLVEALDAETGIGYGIRENKGSIDTDDFLNNIPVKSAEEEFDQLNWHKKMFSFWYPKFNQGVKNGQLSVELTNEELQDFEEIDTRYAGSFTAKTSFYKLDDKDVLLFEYYGGPTSTLWYGRFGNSNQAVNDLNQEIIDHEKNEAGDFLVAEINYLPQSRLGNVIQRAQGRTYQINYLAGVNSNKDSDLPLEDLMIGVREGMFVLASKTLKKEIRTYHSNAFNSGMHSNLPVFQFLAELTDQHNRAAGSLNFSALHKVMKFIPRLTYQNIIFQRASWQFSKDDFKYLYKAKEQDLSQIFTEFREKWHLPKQFVIKNTDNELLIDATHADSISILLDTAKKSGTVELKEFLMYSHESIIKDADGANYNNEILLNYAMSSPKNDIIFNLKDAVDNNVKETFEPGSEWLYYKVYMGIKTTDKFLEHISPYIKELRDNNIIEKWFFMRYEDPNKHIRLRLKIFNIKDLGEVMIKMASIFKDFNSEYIIEKVVMDTYQRELERYGYEAIDTFESIFMHDSIMTTKLIHHCETHDELEKLWLPTLYSMTTLCDLMELEPDDKDYFINWVLTSFKNEFHAFSETTKSINKKYNTEKDLIKQLYLSQSHEGFLSFVNIINERNSAIKPLFKELLKLYPQVPDKMRFLNSLIHMSVNRQFRSKQRFYEFVITDFMARITKTLRYIKTPKIEEENFQT